MKNYKTNNINDRFKFRVFDYDDNKMHDVIEIMYREDNTVVEWLNSEDKKRSAFIGEVPTVQCTGLKDKNGKLIYEGDIVKQNYNQYIIEGCIGGFHCINTNTKSSYQFYVLSKEHIEVIGNIYENKELLNEYNHI